MGKSKVNGKASLELAPDDLALFNKFRIDPKRLTTAKIERLSNPEARQLGLVYGNPVADSMAGLMFPYMDENGNILNRRIRRDVCSIDEKGDPIAKYISWPNSKGVRTLYALPEDWKRWKKDLKLTALFVEAEKSQLAATSWAARLGLPYVFFAMGGKDGWHGLDLSSFAGRRVGVMLDANVWNNPGVRDSELALLVALRQLKADAFVCRLPKQASRGVNGPDDFLATHTDADFLAVLKAPPIEPWLDGLGATWEEWEAAKPPKFVIKDFLQDQAATLIAGLSGDGKTWMMINIVWSLLTDKPLFNYFKVMEKATRIIYLTPENMLGAIKYRMDKFGLGQFVKSGQLIVRTMEYPKLLLTNPQLLAAARGSDVFLDTIVRFENGDENSNSDNAKGLANAIFTVMGAGARLLVGAAHSPKYFSEAEHITLENALRGGGDIGAMLGTAWALKMDSTASNTRVLVKNIKARDMEPLPEFVIVGRPHIDAGRGFQMDVKPGFVTPDNFERSKKKQQVGRKRDSDKAARGALIVSMLDKSFGEVKAAVELLGQPIKDNTLKKEISALRNASKQKFAGGKQ